VPIEPLFYEAFRHDQSFQDQLGMFAEEKRRIGQAASELVSAGEMIALTAGTTTTEVVRSLRSLSGITVVTNTVNVAMELSNRKDINVFVTGGTYAGIGSRWWARRGGGDVGAVCGRDVVGVNGSMRSRD